MKKTFALILAVLFVAVSFSGCGTGPNLGFTYQELGEKLESQFQADQAKLSVGEWTHSDTDKSDYYAKIGDNITLFAGCTNNGSGPVKNITVMLDVKKEIGKTPKPTKEYIYLVKTVYYLLQAECTKEQEEEFERIIINAINYPVMERFTYLTQDKYKYSFRPKTEWFSFIVDLAE